MPSWRFLVPLQARGAAPGRAGGHLPLADTGLPARHGLKLAIAIDDGAPQIVNINEGEEVPDWKCPEWWNKSVADHIKIKRTAHQALASGPHTLRVWMVDPGVVIQRFVIDAGGLKPSYLGPPASLHAGGSKAD